MSKASVTKGKQAERELANLIRHELEEQFGIRVEIKRKLEQSRDGGFDLDGIPFLAIEVKRCETLRIEYWWQQARRQAEASDKIPVLAYRQSRKQWKFMLPFVTFTASMFKRAYDELDYYNPNHRIELDMDSFILLCYDNLMAQSAMTSSKENEIRKDLH